MANSNAFPAIYGYPEIIWNTVYATMSYASTALATATSKTALALASACATTFKNALDALDAHAMSTAASRGYTILSPVLTLGLTISSTDLAYIEARLTALQQFALGTNAILVYPSSNISAALAAGNPALGANSLTNFLLNFSTAKVTSYSPETPPTGLTAANFAADAQAAATAWSDLYILANGVATGAMLDEISYMAVSSQKVANNVANVKIYASSSSSGLATAWNGIVASPSISSYAFANASDPTSANSQQIAIVRLIAAQMLYQFNLLVVNLQQIVPNNVATYTVRYNDSLFSIAASQLGDYSLWQEIATLNGLLPPYITNTPGIANTASPGQQLYLPTNGTPLSSPPAQTPAAYETEFLGYDIFYGPVNQDMLPWTGDLNNISGYQNLAFSLGRRLQTPLGQLIYHPDFGSRIPSEIGNITTQDTVSHIAAYAISAVMSDPRVRQVVNAQANALVNQGVNVSLTALPKGQTSGNSIPVGLTFPGIPVS